MYGFGEPKHIIPVLNLLLLIKTIQGTLEGQCAQNVKFHTCLMFHVRLHLILELPHMNNGNQLIYIGDKHYPFMHHHISADMLRPLLDSKGKKLRKTAQSSSEILAIKHIQKL